MRKVDNSRKSYDAYVRMYNEWQNKGYYMDTKLNYSEYKEIVFEPARKMGMPNIARTTASSSRAWSYSKVREIVNNLEGYVDIVDKEAKKELIKTIKGASRKDLFNELAGTDFVNREEAERVIYGDKK